MAVVGSLSKAMRSACVPVLVEAGGVGDGPLSSFGQPPLGSILGSHFALVAVD